MADTTLRRRLRALRWPITCALLGHQHHPGGGFLTRSMTGRGTELRYTILSVCGRCGQFFGWHHHTWGSVKAEARDCWICKRNGVDE